MILCFFCLHSISFFALACLRSAFSGNFSRFVFQHLKDRIRTCIDESLQPKEKGANPYSLQVANSSQR